MKILIVSNDIFPIGGAQTNRILSYSRSFLEEDYGVKIFSSYPYSSNNQHCGYHDGVYYYNCIPNYTKNGKLSTKLYIRLVKIFNIIKIFTKVLNQKNVQFIIQQDNSVLAMLLFFFYAKTKKIPIICEVNEYPLFIRDASKSFIKTVESFFCFRLSLILYDGMFFMTKTLEKYYKSMIKKQINTKIVPMTVEADRFECTKYNPFKKEKYIAYCGRMANDKDGIGDLIESFILFSKRNKNYTLIILGNNDTEYGEKLKKLVIDSGFKEKILFIGEVPRDDIPKFLSNATILTLSRPDNKQAEGGFPTKLGEYLSTGVPTLVTKVGELEQYLTDKDNIFFANPGDIKDFSDKLSFIINNYVLALKVAQKGKFIVKECFDYKKNGKLILNLAGEIELKLEKNSSN